MAQRVARLPLGLYRHYRGGVYEVLTLGRMEKTFEEVVVYRLHCKPEGQVFVRPLQEFQEDVVTDDHEVRPRFVKVGTPKQQ